MAYTKSEMTELARSLLGKLTRKELGEVELDVLATLALDFYARNMKVFTHRDTWTGDGSTYATVLPHDYLSSIMLRVGEGSTARAEEIDYEEYLRTKENGLSPPSPPYYLYAIDDAQDFIHVYPVVDSGTEVQHYIYYIPGCPEEDADYFPRELELPAYTDCLRWAWFSMNDDPESAAALEAKILSQSYAIVKRAKERASPIYRKGVARQLG